MLPAYLFYYIFLFFPPAIVAPSENKRSEHSKEDGLPVDIKLPVKHVLSRELQVIFPNLVARCFGHINHFIGYKTVLKLCL